MTIDSKNHLVAPAVSTDDNPVIQEDAHRRLSEKEQQVLDLATEEEQETARTIVSRLHVELGHSDPRGMIDSFRRKHSHRLIIAAAKKFSCSACEESQRRRLRPVAARVLHEPVTCLQVDQFVWRHPVLNLHVLGTIMVDAGSRAASVTIHRVMDVEQGLGNVTSEIMLATLLNHWVKYYGKPDIVRTDPEGAFRDQEFRSGLAAKSVRLDIDPGEASWKTGVLGKTLDTIKQSAIRVARRTPDSVSIQEIFDECTTAHSGLHRNRGFSPCQLLLGKTPTDKTVCEDPDLAQCSVEVVDEAAKQRLRVKEESYKAYIEEELSLRKRRKEIHQARPWRHWTAREWCWYWRSGKHKGSRMKGGVFLEPARVLIQERETTAEGVRMKGVVWITEGTSLVRCAVQHMRSLSESEKRLCSIADTKSTNSQDIVRRLPHSTFPGLTTQTDAPDDAWEGWDPRSTRDPSSSSSFWPHQSDTTSRLGPDLMSPSRSMRADDEMSIQEPEATHVSVAHSSASETIPSDVPVAWVEPKDSVQTTPRVAFCSNVLQIRWTVWSLQNEPEATKMIILHFFQLIIMI